MDDATRLADTVIGILSRAVAWFNTKGIDGKAERLIQTLCWEWAHAMAIQHSEGQNRWLPWCRSIYNRLRKHSALGWRSQ